MRGAIFLAALWLAAPLAAQSGISVESAVFVERSSGSSLSVAPADRLLRGDRVVTVLTWDAPSRGRYTLVSAVPAALVLESTSRDGLEVSTDGGRNWRPVADGRSLPDGVTHLRWTASAGDGRLTYRARVR